MSTLQEKIDAHPAQRLAGIRRGIEKEGLRVLPNGDLALTPHPLALGATLTQGVHLGAGAEVPEQLAARLAEVTDRSCEQVPGSGMAQGMAELQKALAAQTSS